VKTIRMAVIGAGHLGRIHARLAGKHEHVELVGIVDPSDEARRSVAEFSAAPFFTDYREVLGKIDAAVVATPTCLHHRVALDLLRSGAHVLIEKPITETLAQADQLVRAAATAQRVIQVGHVERFNPAFRVAAKRVHSPKYIEAVRAGSFTFRSTDIGVVLDLMIHDIDLVLRLVESEVVHIDALGAAVLGRHEDMAAARLQFANGCVANLRASRVSADISRRMQVYGASGYADIDFGAREVRTITPAPEVLSRQFDADSLSAEDREHCKAHLFENVLKLESPSVGEANPILDEQADFLAAIREDRQPQVTGRQGRDALAVAERVVTAIKAHQWNGLFEGPVGAHVAPISTGVQGPHYAQPDAAAALSAERKAG